METETKKSVKERIVIISNEIKVKKEGKNSFTKSSYFQPNEILEALNPLLEKHKLITMFSMQWNVENNMYKSTLTISDIGSNTEDIDYIFDIPMQKLQAVGDAQSAGATQTYAKRYMLMNAFNLADDKEDLDNPKNKPADKVDYEKKLQAVKNLKELETVWVSLPQAEKVKLQSLKDELKISLNVKI